MAGMEQINKILDWFGRLGVVFQIAGFLFGGGFVTALFNFLLLDGFPLWFRAFMAFLMMLAIFVVWYMAAHYRELARHREIGLQAQAEIKAAIEAQNICCPISFTGLALADGTPQAEYTAIRLKIRNDSNEKLTGLLAQLVASDPPILAYPIAFHLPLTLATKTRLDAYRNAGVALPHMPFDLNAGAEKHVELCWLRTGAISRMKPDNPSF